MLDPADLRARDVVVKFFARYCAPCHRTLPAAQKLKRDRADLVVLATPVGVMTGHEARKKGVGGEVVAYVW